MTICKAIEKTWKGDEMLEISNYNVFDGKKYARFVAYVEKPSSKQLIFDIPKDSLSFLPDNSDPVGNTFLPYPPCDGYRIVEKNNHVQRIYVGNNLVYNRIKDGF